MKTRNKVMMALGLVFAGAALAGEFEKNKEEEIGVRGRIVKFDYDEEKQKAKRIYVQGIQYEDTFLDKAIIEINDSTRITRKFTNEIITSNNLKEDYIVEVVFESILDDNNPMIVKAKKIVVLN